MSTEDKKTDPIDLHTQIVMAGALVQIQASRIKDLMDNLKPLVKLDSTILSSYDRMDMILKMTLAQLQDVHERMGDFQNGQDSVDDNDIKIYEALNTLTQPK